MNKSTNEIFKKMLDYLYANKKATNQVDLARKAGVDPVTVSRILNGRVKKTKQETLRQVNAAFGNIFNPEWMRGESNVMLVEDLTRNAEHIDTPMQTSTQTLKPEPMLPDMSSMINAIITAKDETIMSVKRELAFKDEIIANLRKQQIDKDNLIAEKERYIVTLQQQLNDAIKTDNPQKDYTTGLSYPMGVAE